MGSINLDARKERSRHFLPLLIGAMWNIFFGSMGFFNLQLHVSLFYKSITPMAGLIANRIWWFVVILAGMGYGIVAFSHHKFRFLITFGAMGKVTFFFFVGYLWLHSTVTHFAAIVAIGDLLWAIYFAVFIFRTREYGYL